MNYEYMVIYCCEKGTGRICITRDEEILSYDDVEEIDEVIRKQGGFTEAFVRDFKLLRVYEKLKKIFYKVGSEVIMRMIQAIMERGSSKCVIKGYISNEIYNGKKEVVGYEINIGNGKFKNILTRDFNVDIKEVAIL